MKCTKKLNGIKCHKYMENTIFQFNALKRKRTWFKQIDLNENGNLQKNNLSIIEEK